VSDRYGQLSYTSFDAAGSAGGWQVKQTSGDLTNDEERLLVGGVHTVFAAPQPLPAYPTPEQLAARPQRLSYRRVSGDAAAYWHSVPAGADATGRPGNVFAHVLLDRGVGPESAYRPIQLWRSPGWLCPYGKAAVAAAQLPCDPPAPGSAVTAERVVAFALDTSTWRLGVLLGLLDAVAAAMAGGPPVLLGADSADTAAQWIGLTSFLMSVGTARALSFSTFDRADQLTSALKYQQLTAVPRKDLDGAPPGVVTIDETEMLSLGEFGGEPHRTAAGHTIDVTAWSAMAQVAFLDPQSALLLLSDIDTFAAKVTDVGLHPAWPMAMSVLNRSEFSDAAREARTVIAMNSPLDLPAHSIAGHAVRDVVTELAGESTAEAWRILQRLPDGLAADAASELYLRRAITDGAWLDQPGAIPLRGNGFTDRPVPSPLRAAVGPALDEARAEGPVRLLRLADLLLQAGLIFELPTEVEASVASSACHPADGPWLAEQLGERIGPRTRMAVARAVMYRIYTHPMAPPPNDAVLDWLSTGVTFPPAPLVAAATPWDDTWVAAALAGEQFAQREAVTDAQRFWALWWLRVIGAPVTVLKRAAGQHQWDPAELLTAIGAAPLPTDATVYTLLGAPPSDGLRDLAFRAFDDPHNNFGVACAALRLADLARWIAAEYVELEHEAYSFYWDKAVTTLGAKAIHPQAAGRLVVLAAVAAVAEHPVSKSIAALGKNDDVFADALAQILNMVEEDVLERNMVAAAGLVRLSKTDDRDSAHADPISKLLHQAAQRLGGSQAWSNDDIDAVARLMAASSGGDEGALRRFRKVAQKTLTGPSEGHSSLAARLRRSH
jgi:hypothetical protein